MVATRSPRRKRTRLRRHAFTLVIASAVAGLGCVTGIEPRTPATVRAAGVPAPAFQMVSDTGTAVSLRTLVAAGNVALVFYRGHW